MLHVVCLESPSSTILQNHPESSLLTSRYWEKIERELSYSDNVQYSLQISYKTVTYFYKKAWGLRNNLESQLLILLAFTSCTIGRPYSNVCRGF